MGKNREEMLMFNFLLPEVLPKAGQFVRQTSRLCVGAQEFNVLCVLHATLCRWWRSRMRSELGGEVQCPHEMGRSKAIHIIKQQVPNVLGIDVEI